MERRTFNIQHRTLNCQRRRSEIFVVHETQCSQAPFRSDIIRICRSYGACGFFGRILRMVVAGVAIHQHLPRDRPAWVRQPASLGPSIPFMEISLPCRRCARCVTLHRRGCVWASWLNPFFGLWFFRLAPGCTLSLFYTRFLAPPATPSLTGGGQNSSN